ncbi:MAG: hypothetical protein ACTSRI_19755 [Promethearchaeota archaeon]
MNSHKKICLIVLVGHHPNRLKLSIDKESCEKIIFIKEKEKISGFEYKSKVLIELTKYYQKQLILTEILEFNFTEQTRPIAELVYTISRQKILGYDKIIVNISGGLRYIIVWFYIACSITNTEIIHGDFKYRGDKEVGITQNMNLVRIPLDTPTKMQFEFLNLFLKNPKNVIPIMKKEQTIDSLLSNIKSFDSIEDLKEAFNNRRTINEKITRGSINGYIKKLKHISAITTRKNYDNMKEKIIEITYIGISFIINNIFKLYRKKTVIN